MRTAFGLVLVVAGALGTLVPIVPGLALVLAGIAVLRPHHRLSRALRRPWRAWSGNKEEEAPGARPPASPRGVMDDDDRRAPRRRRWSDMFEIFD